MGTTKLKLFREALRELGQDTISDTGDGDVAARALVEAYADAVSYCLEQGYWNFGLRTTTLATGGTRLFGYSRSFPKPSDWLRTVRISDQSSFWPPLENFEDALNHIHASTSPLYLTYVSSHATAGLNLSHWPNSFASYVACELAGRVAARIGSSIGDANKVSDRAKRYLVNALLKDSIDGGTLARREDLIVAEPQQSNEAD